MTLGELKLARVLRVLNALQQSEIYYVKLYDGKN